MSAPSTVFQLRSFKNIFVFKVQGTTNVEVRIYDTSLRYLSRGHVDLNQLEQLPKGAKLEENDSAPSFLIPYFFNQGQQLPLYGCPRYQLNAAYQLVSSCKKFFDFFSTTSKDTLKYKIDAFFNFFSQNKEELKLFWYLSEDKSLLYGLFTKLKNLKMDPNLTIDSEKFEEFAQFVKDLENDNAIEEKEPIQIFEKRPTFIEQINEAITTLGKDVWLTYDVPNELECPIMHALLDEPTQCVPCGHTFSKTAIEKHLTKNKDCPCCRQNVTSLAPNWGMKQVVTTFKESDQVPQLGTENSLDAERHIKMGNLFEQNGEDKEALQQYIKALKYTKEWQKYVKIPFLLKKMKADEAAAIAFLHLAKYQFENKETDLALKNLQEAQLLFKNCPEVVELIGTFFKEIGNLEKSTDQYKVAADLYLKNNKTKSAIAAYQNALNNIPCTETYSKLAQLHKSPTEKAHIYFKGALHFLYLEELEKAKNLIDEAYKVNIDNSLLQHQPLIDFWKKKGLEQEIGDLYLALATTHEDTKNIEDMVLCYIELVQVVSQDEYFEKIINGLETLQNKGMLHLWIYRFLMHLIEGENWEKAEKMATKALDAATENIATLELIEKVYIKREHQNIFKVRILLAALYEGQGKLDLAENYYRKGYEAFKTDKSFVAKEFKDSLIRILLAREKFTDALSIHFESAEMALLEGKMSKLNFYIKIIKKFEEIHLNEAQKERLTAYEGMLSPQDQNDQCITNQMEELKPPSEKVIHKKRVASQKEIFSDPMQTYQFTQGAIDYIRSANLSRIFTWISSSIVLPKEGFDRLCKKNNLTELQKKELEAHFKPSAPLTYPVFNALIYSTESELVIPKYNIKEVLEANGKSKTIKNHLSKIQEMLSWLADDKNFEVFLGTVFAIFSKFLDALNHKTVLEKRKEICQSQRAPKDMVAKLITDKNKLILNALKIDSLSNYTREVFNKLAKAFCSNSIFNLHKLDKFTSVFGNILGDLLATTNNAQAHTFFSPILEGLQGYLAAVDIDPTLIGNIFLETINILRPFLIDRTVNTLLLYHNKKLHLEALPKTYLKTNFDQFAEKMILTLENWAPFFESKTPNKQILQDFAKHLDIQKIGQACKEHWQPFFVVNE
jgi:tetratricopeptide (TPR) repeat protein